MKAKTILSGALLAAIILAASNVEAGVIPLQNAGFEDLTTGVVDGFDVPGNDVPGWMDVTYIADPLIANSGVDGPNPWYGTHSGTWAAFLMGSEDGIYQMTGYTIQSGDVFTVGFWAKTWGTDASKYATLTAILFFGSDPTANAIGSYTTPTLVSGGWGAGSYSYYETTIAATAESIGQELGIRFDTTGPTADSFAQLDDISITAQPFQISVSPTGVSSEANLTIEATIVDAASSFVSAALSLDGLVVGNNNTRTGTTNSVSYAATGLSSGIYTGQVVVVGSAESMTNTWTFEISRPPFGAITATPTGWITSPSTELQIEIVENFSIVGSVEVFLDDELVSSTLDRSAAPTTTVSAAVSGLTDGAHTARIIVTGSPDGVATNDWTFNVFLPANKSTAIVHHWDFSEGSGTNVMDLTVNGAHGVVVGDNYSWIPGGGINLNGGGNSGDWNSGTNATGGAYIDLPNDIISALPGATTFEVVFERNAIANWARVWDFGNSTTGEGQSETGAGYIMLASSVGTGGNLRWELQNGTAAVANPTAPTAYANAQKMHAVVVYDSDDQRTALYVNGVLVDAKTSFASYALSSLTDVNNWIGRSQWSNDAMFNGKIYDMRIYTGIMNADAVAARYAEVISGGGPTVEPDIQSIIVSGGSATLTWTSESGATYTILSKSALTGATWATNKSGIASAGDGTTSDSVPASADAEFYQIKGE